jgi:hypothetical protein
VLFELLRAARQVGGVRAQLLVTGLDLSVVDGGWRSAWL